MRQFLITVLLCFFSIFSQGQDRLYPSKGWSINSGLHLAIPGVVFRNEQNFKSTIPGWQVWVNKAFYQEKKIKLILSIGATQDFFNVMRPFENPNGNTAYLRRRIHVLYGNTELGGSVEILSQWKMPLLVSLGFRAGTPLVSNYGEVYVPDIGSSDVGLNLSLGPRFKYGGRWFNFKTNFYQGLQKQGRNNITTNSGIYDSYLQNRSIGIQLGVFL